MSKSKIIILAIICIILGVSLGVLIWWFVRVDDLYTTIRLTGNGIGDLEYTSAYTRMNGNDMFWWFYPTLSSSRSSRPIVLWVNGVTGLSSSFYANFEMFGPYNINLTRRQDSWINDYNLLFVDAPIGTGFSKRNLEDNQFPNLDENVEHLLRTIQSFYDVNEEYKQSPLYICSQADGAQIAIHLALKIHENGEVSDNLKGIVLGNPIISPALTLTKLGFYLEELGYIDGKGRTVIENFSSLTTSLVEREDFIEAYNQFNSLRHFVNNEAGAVAVNLDNIVEKLTKDVNGVYSRDEKYLRNTVKSEASNFMNTVVAPALGIGDDVRFDYQRENAIRTFISSYMVSNVNKVENILRNTNLTVNIYNGNLDAVSNTPGQLEWINNLEWSGQSQFLNAPRETLVVNSLVEGYFRESKQLRFYYINAAGQSAPVDNSVAVQRVFKRITA